VLKEIPDHTTAAGAARLAERIAAYWRQHGDASGLCVWVEPIRRGSAGRERGGDFRISKDVAVRSNLVGGLPPRRPV
jgi:hypothetical protein